MFVISEMSYAARLLDYMRTGSATEPLTKANLSPAASVDLELLSEAEIQQCETAAESQSELVRASLQGEGGWEVFNSNESAETMRIEVRSLAGAAHLIDLPTGSSSLDLRRALDPECKLDLNAQPAFFCDGVELGDDDLVPIDAKGLPTLIHAVHPSLPPTSEDVTPEVALQKPVSPATSAGRSAVWGTVAALSFVGLLVLFGTPSSPPPSPMPGQELQGWPRESHGSRNSTWLMRRYAEAKSKESCVEQKDTSEKNTVTRTLSRASRVAHGLKDSESLVAMRAKRPLLGALATLPKQAAVLAVDEAQADPLPARSNADSSANGSLAPRISVWKAISQSVRESGKKMAEVWKAPFVNGKELGRRAANFILSALHIFVMRLWQRLRPSKSA